MPRGEKDDSASVARPVQPGDFLILVQRRSDLFQELIRACKLRDLPIAGADRLKVGAELAVRDLAALLSFLATPEDSLSLAVVLKSPLCGWDERALFALAHGRNEPFLWQALRRQRSLYPELVEMFETLMGQTDFLRPYDLIERILTRYDGRRKLLSRLGGAAEDGIDALLSQALNYEQGTIPSLSGFLIWMQSDALEIKRQIESNSNQIRVMTVHGAKGLEAPIVILPDTARRDIRITDQIVSHPEQPLWANSTAERPQIICDLIDGMKQRLIHERERLLYVAITRAEKWLIVAAAGDLSQDGSDWYSRVSAGLQTLGATGHNFGFGRGLRLQTGDWAQLEFGAEKPPVLGGVAVLPPYLCQPAPTVLPLKKTLAPSSLGGVKALSDVRGTDLEAALQYGHLIHLLLEHLPGRPQSDWRELANQLLARANCEPKKLDASAVIAEVTALLTTPELSYIFASQTLAEVDISATVPDLKGRRIKGTIDRLLVNRDEVLAIDFKSNAAVPSDAALCPEGILRQMAAYSVALKQIYPDKIIKVSILWTKTATLMPLCDSALHAALTRAEVPQSDR